PSAPASSAISLNPGDTLAGKYHIERVLGRGSMGVVMLARHIHLDVRVAIKVMLPDVVSHGEHIGRFLREARAAAKIKNEHVARVIDVEVMPNGMPYIVMEFLEGQDLGALLERNGPLPIGDAVDYILEACDALADAHAQGIVHRDFKPANVFLAQQAGGRSITKILDFGISKMSVGDVAMTSTVALMGSPAYMSPEQMLSSRDVDARTDIWAVGVTLYQLLTGGLPFGGTTVPEVCARVIHVEPPPLRASRADVPPGLDAAVMRCLVKNRDQRFQSVPELVAAILPFARARAAVGSNPSSVDARAVRSTAMPNSQATWVPDITENTVPVWGGTVNGESRRASRRWIVVTIAAATVAAAAGLAAMALQSKTTNETGRTGLVAPPVAASPADPTPAPPASAAVPSDYGHRETQAQPVAEPAPGPTAPTPAKAWPNDEPAARNDSWPPLHEKDNAAPAPSPARRNPSPARPKAAPTAPKRSGLPSNEDLFSEPK
ncbi:MAG TPA: serine/threonine-protein kinase, partial [Polyangiaceae bacterium]